MTFGQKDTGRRRRRWLLGLGVAAIASSLLMTQAAEAATAKAPKRTDGRHDVIFVHGIDAPPGSPGLDCAKTWANMKKQVSDSKHRRITWGFYSGDTHCDYKYNGSRDTSLNTLAKAFSQLIYTQFRNKPVDVVAHSMGGLIVRRAIAGSQRRESGFAYPLYVEDVVTAGTPHAGTPLGSLCGVVIRDLQCKQLSPGSDFLKGLANTAQNPQSAFGTDWTVLGSEGDTTVDEKSAVAMSAGHKMIYRRVAGAPAPPDHSGLRSATGATPPVDQYDFHRGRWIRVTRSLSPVAEADVATYHWRLY